MSVLKSADNPQQATCQKHIIMHYPILWVTITNHKHEILTTKKVYKLII